MHRGAIIRMLIGAALLASLTTGVVLAVTHLYAAQRGVAGATDSRLVDLGALAANATLLLILWRVGRVDAEPVEGPEDDR